jgi:hypothetical protein
MLLGEVNMGPIYSTGSYARRENEKLDLERRGQNMQAQNHQCLVAVEDTNKEHSYVAEVFRQQIQTIYGK